MGTTYIKAAQILATQNFGKLFTEKNRSDLSSICTDCTEIPFSEIEKILDEEFDHKVHDIFSFIDPVSIGAASVSQVHRAILKDGKEVAIKIKRKDVTKKVEKDTKQIYKLVHRYGWLFGFKNNEAFEHALQLLTEWIYEETDFAHEKENIQSYGKFAHFSNVNMKGPKEIKMPSVVESLCTKNIIVMDYVGHKVIQNMELTEENKKKIIKATNGYILRSFRALFCEEEVVFHGDPHPGNIYLDEKGNVGFLDMGLIFKLTKKEMKHTQDLFLAAYEGSADVLYHMLLSFGTFSEADKKRLREDVTVFCEENKQKNVTAYFIEMINICIKYHMVPPDFLFQMSKAFFCLNGINDFTGNEVKATDLLMGEVMSFLIEKSLREQKDLFISALKLAPLALEKIAQFGLVKGVSESLLSNEAAACYHKLKGLDQYKDIGKLLKRLYTDDDKDKEKTKTL